MREKRVETLKTDSTSLLGGHVSLQHQSTLSSAETLPPVRKLCFPASDHEDAWAGLAAEASVQHLPVFKKAQRPELCPFKTLVISTAGFVVLCRFHHSPPAPPQPGAQT